MKIMKKFLKEEGYLNNLYTEYNNFIIKQKFLLYFFKELNASDFLIKVYKKLSELSFSYWIFWRIKNMIKIKILFYFYKYKSY